MSGIISLTPEQLREQARVYTQARDAIEQERLRVRNTNEQMRSQWSGQAFQAYLQQYEELEVQVRKFQELLVSINNQLNQYATTVAERDAQDATSFGLR